jgi:hypothetical protein
MSLKQLVALGPPVKLRATVKATTGAGEYQQVSALIPGTDPSLPEVWVNAHDNWRNTGGGNNLTGVGATVEIGRVLAGLVARGTLPRPRRSIRFLWGAEHYSSIYNFFTHPDRIGRVLTFLNVDMVGYHQERAKSVFHLYRPPHSAPHFGADAAEEILDAVGRANTETVREAAISAPKTGDDFDPVYAPSGSRDQLHYSIEDFWGPSDHEDVIALGVPAVLYNDWPDPWIGTQEDDISRADPTQMRRAVITIATTAYYLATVGSAEAMTLARVMASQAGARMARDYRRASALDRPDSSAEAVNILDRGFERESAGLRTLGALGDGPELRAAIDRVARQLTAIHAANRAALTSAPSVGPKAKRPEPVDPIGAAVPTRADSVRGPVHFFRPEYGAAWLRRKTGSDPVATLRLAARGHYVMYEALNFADGRRSLAEIRAAVSAEYGPIPLAEIDEYFRLLERVGVVSIRR